MKVISIGEGIIAGMFYIIFGLVTLCLVTSGDGDTAIIAVNIVTSLISVTLVLVNACQVLANQNTCHNDQQQNTQQI